MPYIAKDGRARLTSSCKPITVGELNYTITKLIDTYLGDSFHYADINAVVGVLECAKLELYRRLAAPYEDKKRVENGDVYKERK
jgi:hypothetical protein